MEWHIGDKFRISGIAELDTHCPKVHTTGEILEFLPHNKARAILSIVETEKNVTAIIRTRDLRPIVNGGKKC